MQTENFAYRWENEIGFGNINTSSTPALLRGEKGGTAAALFFL